MTALSETKSGIGIPKIANPARFPALLAHFFRREWKPGLGPGDRRGLQVFGHLRQRGLG